MTCSMYQRMLSILLSKRPTRNSLSNTILIKIKHRMLKKSSSSYLKHIKYWGPMNFGPNTTRKDATMDFNRQMDSLTMCPIPHMYGGEKFKDIIGELNIGHFFVQESLNKTDDQYQVVLEATEQRQTERVSMLASLLKDKLSLYTSERLGSAEHQPSPSSPSFEKQIQQEAADLAHSSYGNSFLFVIGRIYSSKAKEHIGIKRAGGLPGVYYTMKEKKYITKSLWKTVKTNMDGQAVEKNIMQAEAQKDFELLQDLEELCVMRCYQALWQMVKFEVEATLRKVCETVLQDKSVNTSERLLRAEGLLVLGKIYESNASISESENEVVQLI
ncbi:unnamed protein product [Absidia cylindrospora]